MLPVSGSVPAPVDHQICPAVCVLMKLSFDEEHRHAMNELGKTECISVTTFEKLAGNADTPCVPHGICGFFHY